MKISNMLTMPKTNKWEPIFKFDWVPANISTLIGLAVVLTAIVVTVQLRQQTTRTDNKSVAWYMANPKEAFATNTECYNNPQLKTTENCVNSLHALEVLHKGPNS